jgi:hypothetical protein
MTATESPLLSEFSAGSPITDNPPRTMPASRTFVRYALAICVGVAVTLVWQSYSQAAKQIIATTAPGLGWSPQTKQTIVSWVEKLGWTKPPAGPEIASARPSVSEAPQAVTVAQTAADNVAPMPVAFSLDRQQVQQIVRDVAALRQSMEQIAASQTNMASQINNLLVTDMEIFMKIPTPPQSPAAVSHKPIPAASPSRVPNRRTDVTPNQSLADSFRN